MSMVPCPQCGTPNRQGAEYCSLCQVSFRSPREPGSRPAGPVPAAARRSFYAEQAANRWKSWLLMAVFVVVLGTLGGALAGAYGSGWVGLLVCVGFASAASAGAYFAGDRALLAASAAREVSAQEAPQLHNIVEELCIASGLPKPRLWVIEAAAPNAFATGRRPGDASIAVTSGLLAKMNREQLQGVLAHEMSHIRNLDVRFAMLVAVLVGTVALVCDAHLRGARFSGARWRGGGRRGPAVLVLLAILLALVAPLASRLIQMAISRRRELLADASAVELTRNPLGLASALRVIGTDPAPLHVANRATQHLYIANPVKSIAPAASALFSTHPPLETRIRILESMA